MAAPDPPTDTLQPSDTLQPADTPQPSDTLQPADTVHSCALCGDTAAGPPITWMFEVDPRRGGLWYCAACARQNLRSVEAKLTQEWW